MTVIRIFTQARKDITRVNESADGKRAGVGGITVLVGGYYLTKRSYKGEVKKGDTTVSLTPASPTPEEPEAEANQPAAK